MKNNLTPRKSGCPRQKRQCKVCGATFRTSAKFGNETKCAACYAARRQAFHREFDSWSTADQTRALGILLVVCAAIAIKDGASEPNEDIPHADQDAIDAEFRIIMDGAL